MIEITRKNSTIVIFNKAEYRGVAIPKSSKENFQEFISDTTEVCKGLQEGMSIKPLLYGLDLPIGQSPISDFLMCNSLKEQTFAKDSSCKAFYKFYFARTIPQISPENVDFIYLGLK